MSAGASGDDGSGGDFELNLAPIIDCFTVLITYMLVSASFISFQMIEVSAVAVADTAAPQDPPPVIPNSLSAELKLGSVIDLHVSGKNTAEFTVSPTDKSDWNFAALSSQIQKIRKKWPDIKEVSIKADPTIRYKQMIRVIENLKKDVPKVMVGE